MRSSSSARRFAIVPPPNGSKETAPERPYIAHIVQSNLALTHQEIIPEDAAASGPISEIMVRNVRENIADTLDPDGDNFDFGFGVDDPNLGDTSGVINTITALGTTEFVTISPVDVIPIVEADWEFYRAMTPPIPAKALESAIVIEDLTPAEEQLLAKAEKTAKAITDHPQNRFEHVIAAAHMLNRDERKFFWPELKNALGFVPVLSEDTAESIVMKHSWEIQRLAFKVLHYQNSNGLYELEALEMGFHALPVYKNPDLVFALNKALRNQVNELQQNHKKSPLSLPMLTTESIAWLAPADKKLAQDVVRALHDGIAQKKTEFEVLASLAKQHPGKQQVMWHFWKLLRTTNTTDVANDEIEKHIEKNHARIITIAKQVIASCKKDFRDLNANLDIGFQILPQVNNPKANIAMRKALMNHTNHLRDEALANMEAANLQLAARKRIEEERTKYAQADQADDLQLVVNRVKQFIADYQASPHQKSALVGIALENLGPNDRLVFPKVLKTLLEEEKKNNAPRFQTQLSRARQRIAAAPENTNMIIHEEGACLTNLDKIRLNEALRIAVVQPDFADHERFGIEVNRSKKGLSGTPISKEVIDDHMLRVSRLPNAFLEEIHSAADDIIELSDDDVVEVSTPAKKPGLFSQLTTKLKSGLNQVATWFTKLGKSISDFSFSDFIRNNKAAIGLSTVMAAVPAYAAHNTYQAASIAIDRVTVTAPESDTNPPEPPSFQQSAYGMYMGTDSAGQRQILNFIPVDTRGLNHDATAFQPSHTRFSTPGYTTVQLNATETSQSFFPGEIRVDHNDAMANIMNVLEPYMRSRAFHSAYPKYIAGERDQSILYNNLLSQNPRAHHKLHRVAHGDHFALGINPDGNIIVTQWTNALGINMLAGEESIIFNLQALPHVGGFVRASKTLQANHPTV